MKDGRLSLIMTSVTKKNASFLFRCVFTELRSVKAVLPQSDSHSLCHERACDCFRVKGDVAPPARSKSLASRLSLAELVHPVEARRNQSRSHCKTLSTSFVAMCIVPFMWMGFQPSRPAYGENFDAMMRNFESCRDKEFASHVCSEHPRNRKSMPDAT
jgi:hypothetical protein